ncbi:MAG TPA: response regulator transcription factor [Polyangia bacterium]|nr:response regulator transcription factor [Polyangia bacterium]
MSSVIARVLIIEDQLIVRDALVSLLGARSDIEIVGVAASIREGWSVLQRTAPSLLLLDLSLEDGSGLEVARMLYRARSKTRVLVMTAFGDEFAAAEALKFGVAGYFMKEQPTAELFEAIEAVSRGETYMSPTLAGRISEDPSKPDGPLANLSRREREIFRLAVLGSTSRELAKRLFISVKTVDTHLFNVARKLGVRTASGLVRFAAAHGITIGPKVEKGPPTD